MINSTCAMITSALRSFCRRQFFIMHVILIAISIHAHWIIFISWSGSPQVQPAMCICIPKAKLLICTSSGGALATYEDNFLSFTISHTLSTLKTSTSLSSITKKGEIVSASSATLVGFGVLTTKLVEGLMRLWELKDNAGSVPHWFGLPTGDDP